MILDLISLSSITMTKATQMNNRNNSFGSTGLFGNNRGFDRPQNEPNDISYFPFCRVGTVFLESEIFFLILI